MHTLALQPHERQSLIAAGLIMPPVSRRPVKKPKTAEQCAHHSCRRPHAPGDKLCTHHIALRRERHRRHCAKIQTAQ